ncbi:MAG TPA: helix-turn-helix domain-containing protein [Acidimicrobiales bacterium]|nr:helix-turn-helix domain-containing protein [Acidimicrobiales bacterium]
MPSATYTAEQLSELLGVSAWSIYEAVRNGTCPFEPIRIGRRLVWPRALVDRALGMDSQESA